MTQHSPEDLPEIDRDTIEDIGCGYWETPAEIGRRAYIGQTPEMERRTKAYIADLFWGAHAEAMRKATSD